MEQIISNLGFPIASVVGLAYYFVQKDKSSREDINKIIDNLREDNKLDRELYRDTIEKFNSKLDKFAIALESNNNRLECIEDDVKTIKDKASREDINKIIDNLREDNKLDRELYRDTIDKFDSKLDKFAIALESNNNRLESIEDDIKSIKEKAGV